MKYFKNGAVCYSGLQPFSLFLSKSGVKITPFLCFFSIMVNPWILSHHESQINPNDWLATAALPRWYLKYFSEASNNGPVEAFYASYMPDVQRANKLDLIQPKDTWVLAKRNPPGRASLNKIHKPFLASMLFSKVHIVDGIYILRFILCGCVCMQLRTQICKHASKDEYVFAYAYI